MVISISCTNATATPRGEGDLAANFTSSDMKGNPVSLGDYIGKDPMLLVFFATWCPPCSREVPDLNNINNEYSERGLKVVAVSLDNSRSVLPNFIQRNGINYTVWHDGNRTAAREYEVVGIPTNILINREGVISFRAHRTPSSKEIETMLE